MSASATKQLEMDLGDKKQHAEALHERVLKGPARFSDTSIHLVPVREYDPVQKQRILSGDYWIAVRTFTYDVEWTYCYKISWSAAEHLSKKFGYSLS